MSCDCVSHTHRPRPLEWLRVSEPYSCSGRSPRKASATLSAINSHTVRPPLGLGDWAHANSMAWPGDVAAARAIVGSVASISDRAFVPVFAQVVPICDDQRRVHALCRRHADRRLRLRMLCTIREKEGHRESPPAPASSCECARHCCTCAMCRPLRSFTAPQTAPGGHAVAGARGAAMLWGGEAAE